MAPGVLCSLVCAVCLILLPAAWADYCSAYEDSSGNRHQAQQCGSQYCCGNCERKYCCSNRIHRLSQEEERNCYGSSSDRGKKSRLAVLLGSILGSILPIMLCVCLIICCVSPCCLFFKKCRKSGNQSPRIVINSTTPAAVHLPQQPLPAPSGYQPAYPGYQPVPAQPGYDNRPNPSAPPPYMTTDPAHFPAGYPAGTPMVPFPGQPYAPPPPSAPTSYNPAYVSNL